MIQKTVKFSNITVIVAMLIFFFISMQISNGILFGYICFLLYLNLLTLNMNRQFITQKSGFNALHKLLRMLLLFLPMLISMLYPQYFHLFGVVCGLLMFKAVLYIQAILGKG